MQYWASKLASEPISDTLLVLLINMLEVDVDVFK